MEKETVGTVMSVSKQWWLKLNTSPLRVHGADGAAFPHIIKVKYEADGKEYTFRKWLGAGSPVPEKFSKIKVLYHKDKPSKARADL